MYNIVGFRTAKGKGKQKKMIFISPSYLLDNCAMQNINYFSSGHPNKDSP